MRRTLIGLAALALLLGAVALALPGLVPAHTVARVMAKRLSQMTGYAVTIRGDSAFTLLPTPSFRAADLHVVPHGAVGNELLNADGLRVTASLPALVTGRIAIEGIALIHPVLDLDSAAPPAGRLPAARSLAALRRIEVIDGTLAYRDGAGGQGLSHIEATAQRQSATAIEAALDADMGGEKLHLDVQAPVDCSGPAFAVRAFVRAGGPRLSFDGTPSCAGGRLSGAAGRFSLATDSLRRALAPFGPLPAALPEQQASLGGRLTVDLQHLALDDIELDLAASHAGGSLAFRFGGPPRLQLDLAFDRIELDRWLPPAAAAARAIPGTGAGPAAAPRPEASWQDAPLPELPAIDAAVTLTARSVVWPGGTLAAGALAASLSAGRLRLDRFAGQIDGGSFLATGQLDPGPPPVARLDLETHQLPLHDLPGGGDGRLDLTAALTAEGATPAALAAGLEGKAMLNASDLMIHGLDLAAIDRALAQYRRPADLVRLAEAVQSDGETRFEHLAGTLAAEHGVIRSGDLRLVAPDGVARATLTADLPAGTLTGRIELLAAHAADGPPLAVELDGPLDHPARRIDETALALLLARLGGRHEAAGPAAHQPPARTAPLTSSPPRP